MTRSTVLLIAAAAWLLEPPAASASDPDTAGMQRAFDAMERALKAGEEAPFKAQWDPRGYDENLVGGSGLAGRAVFRQGTRKRWYLKPELAKLRSVPRHHGAPWIVPCEVWSRPKQRAVDAIFTLVIWNNKSWQILGGGERLEEVEALGQRYVAKKPLAPPPRGR